MSAEKGEMISAALILFITTRVFVSEDMQAYARTEVASI